MRVLWVTSQLLPLVAEKLNVKTAGFGNWTMNMISELRKVDGIELGIAMVGNCNELHVWDCDGITCYVAKDCGIKDISDNDKDRIIEQFKPDIIHLEGNEFPIHYRFSAIEDIPVLLLLQGIMSGIHKYQNGDIPMEQFIFNPRWWLCAITMFSKLKFRIKKRLVYENKTIKNVKYITGRTTWDRAHTYFLNPAAKYFSCEHILRSSFYENRWSLDKVRRHTILVGNGYSPLKGLHFALETVKILKAHYPDICIRVAGINPIAVKGVYRFGYPSYIKHLIRKFDLAENVEFLGSLNEDELVAQMLSSHVYLLPSLIENSPLTLSEAMILGVPSVASYVGGVPDMAEDGKDCLFFRANDPKICAWKIRQIFESDDLALSLSENAHKKSSFRHDKNVCANTLLKGYRDILKDFSVRH